MGRLVVNHRVISDDNQEVKSHVNQQEQDEEKACQ